MALDVDTEHDAADVLLLPNIGRGAVHVTVEPLTVGKPWPTHWRRAARPAIANRLVWA